METTQELTVKTGSLTKDWRDDLDAKESQILLKNTVALGATDAEFAMFRELCRATALNPFRKEIWFIKGKPKKDGTTAPCQIMTGVNGFYAIANNHPQYDGVEIENGPEITVPLGKAKDSGSIITFDWVECRVYRKDRSRPQVFRAYWREYAKDLISGYGYPTIWAKMPSVMLTKCAESMALRKAFPQELNGLMTVEELPLDEDQIAPGTKEAALVSLDKSLDGLDLFNPENIRGTHQHLALKVGTNKGKLIGHKNCHVQFLRNHLNKHRAQYTEPEQRAIEMRITDLEQQYAATQSISSVLDELSQSGTPDPIEDDYNGRSDEEE